MPRILPSLDRLLNWVLALLMAVMLAVIAAQVWCRFVINDPLDWSEELGRYLFVWMSFIGAAVGVRHQVHLGIDLMQKALRPRTYRLVVIAVNSIVQVFLAAIIYWGVNILEVVKFQRSPSMHINMVYPYLAVPVGCALMLLNSLRVTWGQFLAKSQTSPPEQGP